jgi:ABC-2 type transport system ATP-binding protein
MIKVKHLSKTYDDKLIIDDVSFDLPLGKFITLLGQNGAGKSTFLRLLSGYELPDKGTVSYRDEELSSVSFKYVHDICFVHENLDFKVPYVMSEFIEIFKEAVPNWDQDFFNQMLKDRKIKLDKNFQEYSRGQKMQIGLMIALASQSKVLLLDEITSVIDVYGRKYFLDLLDQHVKKGNTVIITTNIISELEFYTQQLLILKDQKIALNESIENIPQLFIKLRRRKDEDHEIFHQENCIWAGVNSDFSVSYVAPVELVTQYELPENMFDKRTSTLEDIFIYYFTREELDQNYENVA